MERNEGKTAVIILAGGKGERFGYEKPKQFAKIAGRTIIEHTIEKFEEHPLIDEIYVVVNPHYYDLMIEIVKRNQYRKIKKILYGGDTRQVSSRIGVYALEESIRKVLIHDAVRPFIKTNIITNIIKKLDTYSAVDVAIPTSDTIIKVDDKQYIKEIPDRKYLRRGQTPQGFIRDIIYKAHKLAESEGFENAPDDCTLIARYKLGKIYVIDGDELNIKITYPHDVYIADRVFQLNRLSILDFADIANIKNLLRRLEKKVLVIFGGTSGIGKEISNIGEEEKAFVYPFSRKTGVDVRRYDCVNKALQDVYERHGRIDLVINTAGILKISPLTTASIDDIKEQIEVNLLGSMYITKASMPYLKESRGSITLFTSSSYTRGRENYSPYSASKAGVVNFVQAIADEIHDMGIRINAICPERTKTPMRVKNFGMEPEETLLHPKTVAYVTLITALSNITGQIVDVRKTREEKILRDLGLI